MNIKSERVHQLAKDAAARTGKSQTATIEEALELLLREYGVDPAENELRRRRARVDAILAEVDAERAERGEVAFTDHDLYDDETGLPR